MFVPISCRFNLKKTIIIINEHLLAYYMPKGLKETSSLIAISAFVEETAAGTFTSKKIDLQLNPLDNEVFVVYGIDIDLEAPELIANASTLCRASVSTTERTTVGGIEHTNVLASSRIQTQDVGGTSAVTNEYKSDSAPATDLEYLGIIATNDFFLNILGSAAHASTKFMSARLYGVRARADASVYAALVQSEVLS